MINRIFNKNVLFAWVTFFVILLITISIYFLLRRDTIEEAESYFKFRVHEITSLIQQRMKTYEQVLSGCVGLFNASDSISRDEWRSYIEKLNIEKHYTGILGIGFAQVVKPEQLALHTSLVRAEGFPEYKIWPEYEREIYTTVIYLEPFSGRNLRAFGYDMFTEKTRRTAMTNARDSAVASLSGKVTLVQETSTDVQPGFLLYLPVYNKYMPLNTIEQRREALKGYVYSPFRINDLMQGILAKDLTNIALQIYDESDTSGTGLMYNSHKDDLLTNSRFTSSIETNFNNHKWTLKFKTLPSFEAILDKQKPLIVLLAGIIISFLFFSIVLSFIRTNEIKMDLELILASSGEGIYGVDMEGKCMFINTAAQKMLDLTIEQCKGRRMHDIIHHHYDDNRVYPFNECPIYYSLQAGTSYQSDSEVFFKSNGTKIHVRYSFSPIIQDNKVDGGVVSFSDITEKIKIQQAFKASEEKFRLAVDNFPYTFIIYDKERRITFINSTGRKSFYIPGKQIIGMRDEEILPPEITGCYYPSLLNAFEKKTNQTTECTLKLSGNEFSFIANFVPLLNDKGEIDQVLGIIHDITELKKAQENIINSLKEKDVLLKEIHHRVKNNLQIISSLLSLQSNKIKDEALIEVIKESQNRVRSMALIHERLYQTANMSQIDFSEYIPELLNFLVTSYNNKENPVRLELQIVKTKFNIDISISLALIINELVSNSMKHAFNSYKNRDNIIAISLVEQEKYILTVSDNGKGFPGDVDFRLSNSLGLQLVNTLVEQIEGEIELQEGPGTKFIIRFPV